MATRQIDNSFDAVWSSSALFTHPDKKDRTQALRDLIRVLNPSSCSIEYMINLPTHVYSLYAWHIEIL